MCAAQQGCDNEKPQRQTRSHFEPNSLLTRVDACARGDHDDVAVGGRGLKPVYQERPLQLHGGVDRILLIKNIAENQSRAHRATYYHLLFTKKFLDLLCVDSATQTSVKKTTLGSTTPHGRAQSTNIFDV